MLDKIYAKLLLQKKRLSPFYRKYPPRFDIQSLDQRIAVSHSYNYVYFRIPKAANSTIISSLYHAETQTLLSSREEMNNVKKNYFIKASTLSKQEVATLLADYFKFTFVRNPYERIVSGFLDKIARIPFRSPKLEVAHYLNKDPNEAISFDEFLDYLGHGNGYQRNHHWARQMDLLPVPAGQLDFIGKTEYLDKDLPRVLKRIFGNGHDVVNWRVNVTGAQKQTGDLLNESRKKMIRRIYECDFEAFGYE